MALNMSNEVTRTFNLLGLKRLAARNLNNEDWHDYRQITDKYADLRRFEKRNYETEYKTRVEVARKRLINKAGEKNRDLKHRWFGRDQFDKSAILRQAQRDVRANQDRLMAGIDDMEARDLRQLLDRAGERSQSQVKPRPDFEKSADRRARDGLPKDRRKGRKIGR